MRKNISTLIYFLSLTYYGHTTGQCMEDIEFYKMNSGSIVCNRNTNNKEEYIWDNFYSERYSLISGVKFHNTEYMDKAAITVGIRFGTNTQDPHAYAVFEYLDGDKIKLRGFDMRSEKASAMSLIIAQDADTNSRSHEEVLRDFLRYKLVKRYKNTRGKTERKESIHDTKFKKIISFIVPKPNAIFALNELKEENPVFDLKGTELILKPLRDEKKQAFNCCTYALHVLDKVGIKITTLDRNYAVNEKQLNEAVLNYQPPRGIQKITPKNSKELLEEAIETVPISVSNFWKYAVGTLTVGLTGTVLYNIGYEGIATYLTSLM